MKKKLALIFLFIVSTACAGSIVMPETEIAVNPAPSALPTPLPPSTSLSVDAVTTISTVAIAHEDKEALVLEQVAQTLRCPPHQYETSTEDTSYRLVCAVAAGHSVDVQIQRFPVPVEARAEFDVMREDAPIHCFSGAPAYEWQFDERPDDSALPMRHQGHAWQVDRWLIVAHAFDDTGYALAPEPLLVSEAVYQAATKYALFPAQANRDPAYSCP